MPKVSEEHIDSRKKQIIDAAYQCFARKGFHQATMRDIYSEAGLSPGAVYNYFKSKDEIIEASFVYDYQRSLPIFEKAAEEVDPMTGIDHLIDFFYKGLESAAALGADRVNIQSWGEALVNPRLTPLLRTWFSNFNELLEELIIRGQSAGRIRKEIDPPGAAEVIVSSYLGLYLQKAFIPELDVDKYKQTVKAMLHGTFAAKSET